MTKQEFLDAATRAALASSRASGFPAGITVAQAALESRWGRSQLSREAHNYFGIKAHGRHQRVAYATYEFIRGRRVRVGAEFARYASMEECFADRDRIIGVVGVYAEARDRRHDPEAFARALAAHWATDPHYADKVLRVYREHGLDSLDSPSPDHPIAQSPDSEKEQI